MSEFIKQVDDYLVALPTWQRDNLISFRNLVHNIAPTAEEEWKWGVPVFLVSGKLVCAMSVFKDHTKYNFFEGAKFSDPHGVFNSGLDSQKHRSINLQEGEQISSEKLSNVIEEAVRHSQN